MTKKGIGQSWFKWLITIWLNITPIKKWCFHGDPRIILTFIHQNFHMKYQCFKHWPFSRIIYIWTLINVHIIYCIYCTGKNLLHIHKLCYELVRLHSLLKERLISWLNYYLVTYWNNGRSILINQAERFISNNWVDYHHYFK